jgi:hypothetical protein
MRYISDGQRLNSLLQYWVGDSGDLVISTFFFWISGNPDQSSQVGLLRSLLFKLLSSRRNLIERTPPNLWSDVNSCSSSILTTSYAQTFTWTLSRLKKGFQLFFSQDIGHIFLLIDGLDEYRGDAKEIVKLFKSILLPEVKICLLSRPWQIFEDFFRETAKLRLQNLMSRDISGYVNDVLCSNEKMQELCVRAPFEAPKLVDEIVAKADGVFFWAHLVVTSFLTSLKNRDQISHLRKRLEEIPARIEGLYSYMLLRLS